MIKALLEVVKYLATVSNIRIPFLGMIADYNPEKSVDGKLIRAFWYDSTLHLDINALRH